MTGSQNIELGLEQKFVINSCRLDARCLESVIKLKLDICGTDLRISQAGNSKDAPAMVANFHKKVKGTTLQLATGRK